MKKLLALLLILLLMAPGAMAANDYIDLEPGLYKVGEDVPTGKYDIRFNGLDREVTISFSEELKDGLPDLSKQFAFTFTFTSEQNWWNIGGFLVTLYHGYLQIESSPVRMWPE